eukprot:2325418-Pyramimonas_sp.AAC.1
MSLVGECVESLRQLPETALGEALLFEESQQCLGAILCRVALGVRLLDQRADGSVRAQQVAAQLRSERLLRFFALAAQPRRLTCSLVTGEILQRLSFQRRYLRVHSAIVVSHGRAQ